MLSPNKTIAILFISTTIAACGGGNDDGPEIESEATQSNGSVGQFAGTWKQKNFCIGPHSQQHVDSFARGKYATIIMKNDATSTNTMNTQLYKLWFKNPACTGIGERSPNERPEDATNYCSKYIESVTIAGNKYEKFSKCNQSSATSLERIHNGELELIEDIKQTTLRLTYVRYL